MRFFEVETAREFDFTVKFSGDEERFTCPICSHNRKKSKEKCVSINPTRGTGFCHNCGARYVKKTERIPPRKEYVKPSLPKNTDLPDDVIQYFESRKITLGTLKNARITKGTHYFPSLKKKAAAIEFNYFQGEELVYVKYRTRDKHFSSSKGAEPIIYNLNGILGQEEVIITEGEIDVLSFMQVGFNNTCSFPNGALDHSAIDHNIEYFEQAKKIYLAVDQDSAGITFREELRRRLGSERCFRVDFEEHKDANDYLMHRGIERLKGVIKNAKPFPVEGLVTAKEYEPEILKIYEYGINPGLGILHSNLNKYITWETGRLCVISGAPGHGKSEFVDEICSNLNVLHEWKTVYFSPENWPVTYHIRKLLERISGRPMLGPGKLNQEELIEALYFVDENFKFILSKDEEYSLDKILEVARGAIHAHGCKIVVLDPWNRISHLMGKNEAETNYISRMLSKISNFAQKNDVLFILVAHPRKLSKSKGLFEAPNLYDVAGSAAFYNKADYGLTVYRNFHLRAVQVHVQKVRYRHLGKVGTAVFLFNELNGRYHPIMPDPKTGDISFNWEEEREKFDNKSHIKLIDFKDPEPDLWDNLETLTDVPF